MDCSIILNSNKTPTTLTTTRHGFDRVLVNGWMQQNSSFACRRAASFPTVSRHCLLPSLMKVRTQSESEALHRIPPFVGSTSFAADLKRQLSDDEENGSEQQQMDDASSGVSSIIDTIIPIVSEPRKKRVQFADDCGFQLSTVRVMTEPSDYPPKLSPSVLRKIFGDAAVDESTRPTASWTLGFSQPASEYIKFRETLERQMVALENVVLRNEQCKMVGTVKVKNIAFEKRVYLRVSDNHWRSYMDYECTFVPAAPSSSAGKQLYDTFSFDISLTPNDDKHDCIDFCVCYRTDVEYWDSNGGCNYSLFSPDLQQRQRHAHLFGRAVTSNNDDDAYHQNYDSWTGFASWKNLTTDGPYW